VGDLVAVAVRTAAGGRWAGGGVPGACGQATVGRQRGAWPGTWAWPDGSGPTHGVCLDGGRRAVSCRAGGGVSGEAAAGEGAGEGERGGDR
jgi:hypothetical protein